MKRSARNQKGLRKNKINQPANATIVLSLNISSGVMLIASALRANPRSVRMFPNHSIAAVQTSCRLTFHKVQYSARKLFQPIQPHVEPNKEDLLD